MIDPSEQRSFVLEFTVKTKLGDLTLSGRCASWNGSLDTLPEEISSTARRLIGQIGLIRTVPVPGPVPLSKEVVRRK